MTMEQPNVQIGLRAVNETVFTYHSEMISNDFDPKNIRLGFKNRIAALDIEKNFISVEFGVKYSYGTNDLLESVCKFDFNVLNLKNFVITNPDKSVKINVIMPFLLSTALGTLRGVLLARTGGTRLHDFPLPIINVEQLIKGLAQTAPKA